ncbi:hypothetical protein [Altericista sp. CCNU0014]|uniref:hypothetical protein n=1 Tax=Altericista sp. CCNU0014 TaxID=3082949 RepID=UPI00384BDDE4
MPETTQPAIQPIAYLPETTRQERRQLLNLFWLVAGGLFLFEVFGTQINSLQTTVAGLLITAAALLPSYLWCSGKAFGFPVFPLSALPFIWTHALPLISQHPKIITYSPIHHLYASLTTTGFLLLGTWVWFQFVKSPPPLPQTYRALSGKKGESFFLGVLVLGILFTIAATGGWLLLSGGSFALVRGGILGLTALATFTLAYRAGSDELSSNQTRLFWVLIILHMIVSAAGLLLVGAMVTFLTVAIAFSIGRKKPPTSFIVFTLVCLILLHGGKGDMRAKYWVYGPGAIIQPWQYPAWYAEWADYSLTRLNPSADRSSEVTSYAKRQSFAERSSVIHLLLLAQTKTPESVPYLSGETYAIVPQLLIPRIFDANKIRSHEGTYILNIHYGLQRRQDTYNTTIGWGLLNEAYANFGNFGCAGLAIVLGIAYGKTTRWSINAPLLSAQSLFAILMITFSFQTEWSAGVYVAALFQSSMSLLGIVVFLMKTYPSAPILQSQYELE